MWNTARPDFMMNPALARGFMMDQAHNRASAGALGRPVAGQGGDPHLTAFRPRPANPFAHRQLQSILWAWGVSFPGAYQLANGQPVINPADRHAVAAILWQLLKIVGDPHGIKL